MSHGYKVEIISPHEAEALLARMRRGPDGRGLSPRMVLTSGVEVKGSFELTARDEKSGEIEWEYQGENLITDLGRRAWMDNRFYNCQLGFSPNKETPTVGRSTIPTDTSQGFQSGNLTPSNNSSTNTKTFSTTFTTPGSNRTLGCIYLGLVNGGTNSNFGPLHMLTVALLSPAKVQTTTQTLEVVYKFSMNPIY